MATREPLRSGCRNEGDEYRYGGSQDHADEMAERILRNADSVDVESGPDVGWATLADDNPGAPVPGVAWRQVEGRLASG